MRLGEKEEVTYEAVTTAVRKAVRLNRAIQAKDGHWPAENAGPLFFTAPLVCFLRTPFFLGKKKLLSLISELTNTKSVIPNWYADHGAILYWNPKYCPNTRTQSGASSLHY